MEFYYKLLTIDQLLTYFDEKVIKINCRQCNEYKHNWSCPPHAFDERTYLSNFIFHYLIVLKINNSQAKEQDYHNYRKILGNKLLSIENNHMNSELLYAGNCYHCGTCSRMNYSKCKLPKLMRYSYESLGIELLTLLENEFNLEKNEGLKIVSGIMFNEHNQRSSVTGELKELKNELL